MCTVTADANISLSDSDLRKRIQDTAVTNQASDTPDAKADPPSTSPPTSTNDAIGALSNAVDNPQPAGGGDKGMQPNEPGVQTPDTTDATSTATAGTSNAAKVYAANADGSFNGQSYLDAHPDVMAEYNRLIGTADRNSPWFKEHGLDQGAVGFAQWHANNGGYSTSGGGTGTTGATGGDGGATTATSTLDGLAKGFNDTIKNLTDSTKAQIDALNANSTSLTAQIAEMQKGFATSQQELLDNMNKAAAAQSASFSKALKDLTGANGQGAKKPNYGKALQRNKDLNGQGIGATMLTGPNGVAIGSASLGTTSLLGA